MRPQRKRIARVRIDPTTALRARWTVESEEDFDITRDFDGTEDEVEDDGDDDAVDAVEEFPSFVLSFFPPPCRCLMFESPIVGVDRSFDRATSERANRVSE